MKKSTKLLSTCLTLAIAGTTFAPATSAVVDHSGKKRPSPTNSETAKKRICITKYPNSELFRQFQIKEQQRRKRETPPKPPSNGDTQGARCTAYQRYLKERQEELDREDNAIENISEEERQFIYNLIMSSRGHLLVNPSNCKRLYSEQAKLCMNYLKRQLDYTIVCIPRCYWPGTIKCFFSTVFKEKTDCVVNKILSYLDRLDKFMTGYTSYESYEEAFKKILDELKTYPVFSPHV